jgi:hypothetical protein
MRPGLTDRDAVLNSSDCFVEYVVYLNVKVRSQYCLTCDACVDVAYRFCSHEIPIIRKAKKNPMPTTTPDFLSASVTHHERPRRTISSANRQWGHSGACHCASCKRSRLGRVLWDIETRMTRRRILYPQATFTFDTAESSLHPLCPVHRERTISEAITAIAFVMIQIVPCRELYMMENCRAADVNPWGYSRISSDKR